MAKKVIDLTITKAAVEVAIRRDKKHCPLANAITDYSDNIFQASVDTQFIKIFYHNPEMVNWYRTPKPARDFVIDFDNGRNPKPFRLIITEDDWYQSKRRKMKQREQAEQIAKRKSFASAHGLKLADVRADDVPKDWGNDSNGFVETKVKTDRVKRRPKERPRKQYAKRVTTSEMFAKVEAEHEMARD